jgi:hypothetical protein
MSENNEIDDLGLDAILDDEETGNIETDVVENEAGEVMFDPNRVVTDEEAAETLASSEAPPAEAPMPTQVGEVTQQRITPENAPEVPLTPMERRAKRRQAVKERNERLAREKAEAAKG